MSWTEEKVNKLKELWGRGNTASQIAEIIGGISRNAVIGKAHRLKLSSKIIKRHRSSSPTNSDFEETNSLRKRSRKVKFRFKPFSYFIKDTIPLPNTPINPFICPAHLLPYVVS